MSTLALILRQRNRVKIAFTDQLLAQGVQVDFLEGEQHTWDVAITKHPVEAGGSIVDHIQPQPRRVVISGAVSDVPLNLFQFISAINPFSESRTVSLINFLRELYDDKKLVTISTRYQTYENMAVTSIAFERSPTTAERLPYQITFEEVRLVSSLVVPGISAAKDLIGAAKSKGVGSATKDVGKKPPVAAPAGTDPLKNASDLSKIIGVGR
jgi:hypothetical protein